MNTTGDVVLFNDDTSAGDAGMLVIDARTSRGSPFWPVLILVLGVALALVFAGAPESCGVPCMMGIGVGTLKGPPGPDGLSSFSCDWSAVLSEAMLTWSASSDIAMGALIGSTVLLAPGAIPLDSGWKENDVDDELITKLSFLV